jgi:hypothetical protein
MREGILSGRAARRASARALRLKGAGYTRSWRKGRTKRRHEEVPNDQVDGQ